MKKVTSESSFRNAGFTNKQDGVMELTAPTSGSKIPVCFKATPELKDALAKKAKEYEITVSEYL